MSPTCKLKTFHEYKALISFKFANKYSKIKKISHALHNTTLIFEGNLLIEKGEYLVIEWSYFLCRVIKIKFYWFIAAFLFLDRWESKEIDSSFEVPLCPYLLEKIPLHCINIQREETIVNQRIQRHFSAISIKSAH